MIKAIAIDDEPLALNVTRSLCDSSEVINLQATFTQPGEALAYLQLHTVDLIFCDIQMPSMTGISLVKLLPKNIMVIFTTAFSEYAVQSYDLNAIDYLLKPINKKRFTLAVNKAQEYFDYINNRKQSDEQVIYVRSDLSLVKISTAEILYVEGWADYLKIYIKDRKTVLARMTMKDMMEKLSTTAFIRVHRSYILPFNKIDSVRGTTILMGDQEFPIGKTYVGDFFSRYGG